MVSRRLVLASASPRRRELLERAGFEFAIDPADIDESSGDDVDPLIVTCRLAAQKAAAVAARRSAGDVVLGADTTVLCDGVLYGKPVDYKDACRQLANLAGRNHVVITAWAILALDAKHHASGVTGFTRSIVRMREVGRVEIERYVSTGESHDKAGAYAVQGMGRGLVAVVLGSVDNVIGLPVEQVGPQLELMGIGRRNERT